MVVMAPGGVCVGRPEQTAKERHRGEKMHIVMFPNGKKVRISRLAEPTFSATSECSPMTTAPVQACPALYPTVSD